jgi:hypothetical protein
LFPNECRLSELEVDQKDQERPDMIITDFFATNKCT